MGGIIHAGTGESKVQSNGNHDQHASAGNVPESSVITVYHIEQGSQDPEDGPGRSCRYRIILQTDIQISGQ